MRHNRKQSSWNRSTDRCNSTPISGFFEMDPLEAEALAVAAALEAEGDTLETSNLDRLILRGMEWGYYEMPHRTEFPVTTAESWDILPESAGLLEDVLQQVEAMLTW